MARRDRAQRADFVDRWGWIAVAVVWVLVGLLLRLNLVLYLVLAALVSWLVAWNGRARIKRRALIEEMREQRRQDGI